MTAVISDTDILSAFGKIARIELLLLLFKKCTWPLPSIGNCCRLNV